MKKDENLGSWIFFLGYWWLMLFVNVKQTICKHLDGNAGKLYVIEFSQNKKPIFSPCDLRPLHWDCHVCRMKDDCQVYYKIGFQIFYFMLYADFGEPEHANLLNNRKLQKHQIHCNLLCFDFHKCPIFRPKCTPWLKPSTSLQPFFSFLCEIWLSFTRKLLTLNLSSARYLYQWEKAKDLVSVRGFLLVLNSRLVVNNAPTSY